MTCKGGGFSYTSRVCNATEMFEKFCEEHYGGFRNSSSSCPKSKTVTRAKGESIVKVLKGNHGPNGARDSLFMKGGEG